MNLGQPQKSKGAVTKADVKICALCGALNHEENAECFTCAWHGDFIRDPRTLDLAWQRLESLYEEIRREHVTARRRSALGDFGAPRPSPFLSRLAARISAAWERFQTQRDLRMAQRAAALKSRIPSRPDQLGV